MLSALMLEFFLSTNRSTTFIFICAFFFVLFKIIALQVSEPVRCVCEYKSKLFLHFVRIFIYITIADRTTIRNKHASAVNALTTIYIQKH